MAAGEPAFNVAVASGLRPHAAVSDVRAMAPASSWMPVRGRFIVVSGVRGAWRSGTAGEGGAVAGGTAKDAVEATTATCSGGLWLVAADGRHEEEQQSEGGRPPPEDPPPCGGPRGGLGSRLPRR